MAQMLSDGNHKITWVPTLADFHNPSAAELNTGLDVQCIVSMNDFTLGVTGENAVDDPALCSTSNDQSPGRKTYDAGMNFYRYDDEASDVAWATFTDKGLEGYLVRRIGKSHELDWEAGDEAQVYNALTGSPQIMSPTAGAKEKFRQGFYIQGGKTDERATVAA